MHHERPMLHVQFIDLHEREPRLHDTGKHDTKRQTCQPTKRSPQIPSASTMVAAGTTHDFASAVTTAAVTKRID